LPSRLPTSVSALTPRAALEPDPGSEPIIRRSTTMNTEHDLDLDVLTDVTVMAV